MEERDLVIIGGGPAGYVAAIRGAQLGARVSLIERDTLGGTCLNRGCIPTNALARAAELLELPRKARDFGISLGQPEFSFARMMARKDTVVKTLVAGVELLLEANKVEVITGAASLASSSVVQVSTPGKAQTELRSPRVIIASGSSPAKPAVPGAAEVSTTDDLFNLKEAPASMVVLGGGSIGVALAMIFARFGSSVTVVERSNAILPGVDGEIVSLLDRELRRAKVHVHRGCELKQVIAGPDGVKKAVVMENGQQVTLEAAYIVAADQRLANTAGLNIEPLGVDVSDSHVHVNNKMETSVPGIYAAGDVTGEPMLANVAFLQGKAAAENALGRETAINLANTPHCVSSFPEVAWAGLTEQEAAARGHQVQKGIFPYAANGLATVYGERNGMIKIVSEARYGQILGVHIIGPSAREVIGQVCMAMQLEETPQSLAGAGHIHPSLSEIVMEAGLDLSSGALHAMSQR